MFTQVSKLSLFLVLVLLSLNSWAQIQQPPGSGGGTTAGTLPVSALQGTVLAEYLMTEAGPTLTDYSTNGNSVLCSSNCPTWLGGQTGGISFNGTTNQILLPASITNSIGSIMAFVSFNSQNNNASGYNAIMQTTGGGLLTTAFMITDGDPSGSPYNLPNSYNPYSVTRGAGGRNALSHQQFLGTGLLTLTFDTTDRIYTNCCESTYVTGTVGATTRPFLGQWQLGGASTSASFTPDSHFNGTIYMMVLFSTVLTPAQVNFNYLQIANYMSYRGVPVAMGNQILNVATAPTAFAVFNGDSITQLGFPTFVTFPATLPAYKIINVARAGGTVCGQSFPTWPNLTQIDPVESFPAFSTGAGPSIYFMWAGTNDVANSSTPAATVFQCLSGDVRNAQAKGARVYLATPIDRQAAAGEQAVAAFIRQNQGGLGLAGFFDTQANPSIGCAGCNANTVMFSDGVHVTQGAEQMFISPNASRLIGRTMGNMDWSTATTYASGAPAATAITSATWSTAGAGLTLVNSSTFGSTLNPPLNSTVTIAGVTPAAYNTSVTNRCIVTATNGANFTCTNSISANPGAGSVFGTAKVPQQANVDAYAILGGGGAGNTYSLQPCDMLTGSKIYLKNTNTNAWTVAGFETDLIDGAASVSVAAGATLILQVTGSSYSTTPVCSWAIVQNAP